MTDTPNLNGSTPTEAVEVNAPISTPKPYDDEIFETYTEDTETETSAEPVKEQATEPPKEESTEEEAPEASQKTDEINKSTKNDKVEDGIEEIAIKRPINGKEVNFKIKDAIQAYVKQEEFNRNMDRRITHVSQREQAWQKDQEAFKGNLTKLMEVAQGGDFVTAVRGLAKIATHGTNLDPVEFEKQYFDQLDKVKDVWGKMSKPEREAYFAKRALAERDEKLKRFEEDKALEQGKSQLQEHVSSLIKENELTPDEFWKNYEFLKENLIGEGKPFNSTDDIEAEHIVNYSLEVRRQQTVFEAAKKAGLEDPAKVEYLGQITASDPSLTVDEIVNIIKRGNLAVDVAPASAVENLNRKAGKSNTQFSKASSTKKDEKTSGYDKEDIDYLYRNQPKGYSRTLR